ncbi:unnamed protein product [Rotaria sp. Silwood2]|nr:unnamed protein product [Rotaria sp. Silwood2]CAF2482428.1 unnamed protein product [Rotaria sp. Silwood2]CAF2714905.1 unnamed protein product [Rotaria sp. Silwood2]CAF2866544.1 unnamed protein product [Rotaria sp. Silwood2]CAF4388020.1 unnamed protein product [Rotaria sp. Silwood2]
MSSQHSEVRIVENPNKLYEYSKNVRLPQKPVPTTSRPAKLYEETKSTIDIPFDFVQIILSGYIHINPNESFKQNCVLSCTSLCLYVIRGHSTTKIFVEGQVNWLIGDLLVISYQTQSLEYFAHNDTAFYYVHDGLLLKYLRVKPHQKNLF